MTRKGLPRKNYGFDEERFDKYLVRFLRYTIFEDDIEKLYREWGERGSWM